MYNFYCHDKWIFGLCWVVVLERPVFWTGRLQTTGPIQTDYLKDWSLTGLSGRPDANTKNANLRHFMNITLKIVPFYFLKKVKIFWTFLVLRSTYRGITKKKKEFCYLVSER
ncbi:hypothetical protein BpHYR1_016432 [Brachionus plicatilis]|uniref:Uncharacterized protein n=1 Tax=Brachionus plicatilis TaxID=10195 RepID=A0A3M7RPL3_BRAPC|nr:hypothetical protein BpHYR1_016432 [Brachionus plicatilis]